jgi:magnesium transporter
MKTIDMIEILKNTNGELKHLNKPIKGCWINLVSPTRSELHQLKSLIDIPNDIITSVKDKNEISSIEKYKDNLFVLVRVPKAREDLEYETVPIGIIKTNDYVITISYYDNEIIEILKTKQINTVKQGQFGLHLLLTSTEAYMKYLGEINKKVYNIRKELQRSMKNKNLMKLLDIEKSLVYFNTSLEANKRLVEKMKRDKIFKKQHTNLVDDVMEEYSQAIQMTKIYSDILTGMMDGFSSVISNKLNTTMRFLTSVTIILMLPTLVSSIYGMNISLPLESHPSAFVILMLGSILLAAIGIVFFWKSDML